MSVLSYLYSIDNAVTAFLFSLHTPLVVSFFTLVTQLGNTWPVTVITILISIWFLLLRQYRYAGFLAVAVSGAAITTSLLKVLFARTRPDYLINQLDTFSFPSGHATSAMALYGTLFYIHVTLPADSRLSLWFSWFLIILIFFIGFSRIYLGYHYLSDVLIGYLVGLLWVLGTSRLLKIKR